MTVREMVGSTRCWIRSSTVDQNPLTVGDCAPDTENSVLPIDWLIAIATSTTARPATAGGTFSVMIESPWEKRSANEYCREAVKTPRPMPITVDSTTEKNTSWALTPIRNAISPLTLSPIGEAPQSQRVRIPDNHVHQRPSTGVPGSRL